MTDEFMRRPPTDDPSLPFRLTADDLISDMAWPKLLRVPRLAFRPGRIGLGVAVVLVLSLLEQLLAQLAGGATVVDTLLAAVAAAGAAAASRPRPACWASRSTC